jgi:hypothetical protein
MLDEESILVGEWPLDEARGSQDAAECLIPLAQALVDSPHMFYAHARAAETAGRLKRNRSPFPLVLRSLRPGRTLYTLY